MTFSKTKTHVRTKTGHRKPVENILTALLIQLFESEGPVLVAVGGPGGTGKSTFTKALAALLPDSAIFTLDDYKTPRSTRQNRKIFGAHPEANDIALLRQHMDLIRKGRPFEKPVYDDVRGRADQTRIYHPKRFNLLDGEISTYHQFRDRVDFAIFIDSDWKTQLKTRISRDIEERKYTREKAIATFLESNLREFQNFGAESKAWADVHLYCREDYRLIIESVAENIYHRFESLLIEDLTEIDLSGLVVPVTTPFNDVNGIDQAAFIEHLEFLADHGVQRVLVAGTTGEFFSLTPEERKQLLGLTRRYFPGVVLFQAGAESLSQTLLQQVWAEDFGADAVLVLPPFYYTDLTDEGLIRYFRKIQKQSDLPLILYNFPRHAGLRITADILSRTPHFGLKDSSADLNLISATPHYFLGGDAWIEEAFRRGAYGFLSARANCFPEIYVEMESAVRKKDWEKAKTQQKKVQDLLEIFGGPGEIQKVKLGIRHTLKKYPCDVRLPLLALPQTGVQAIRDKIRMK